MDDIGKLAVPLNNVNGVAEIFQSCKQQISGSWIELTDEDKNNGCGIHQDQVIIYLSLSIQLHLLGKLRIWRCLSSTVS